MTSTPARPIRILSTLGLALGLSMGQAQADEPLNIVSSGGFAPAYKALAPLYEQQHGARLQAAWGPSMGQTVNAIPARLARHEAIDVVIMVGDSLDQLMQSGQLVAGSKVVLAHSYIACAVAHGAPHPDIGTVDAFREALLKARSVAYSDSASGEYIKTRLLDRLGIREQMQGKARQIPATPVGEMVRQGEADFGCQQKSELMAVPGIDILGLIPQEIQLDTEFSAAIVAGSPRQAQSRQLLQFLSAPDQAEAIRQTGLDPVSKAP